MAKKMAFSSTKGGCGKSHACQNIAAGLAKEGYNVLVVDLDSNPCLSRHMYSGNYSLSINDVFDAVINDSESIEIKEIILHTKDKNVDLIPASNKLAITEIKLPGVMGCDFIIKEAIEELEDEYDYILFDCPGNTSKLTANALVASDTVLIPIEATDDSLEVIKNMQSIIKGVKRENPRLKVEGFMLNKIDRRVKQTKSNIVKIRSACDEVLLTEIPSSCRASEAADKVKSVFDIKSAEAISEAYKKLTREIVEGSEIKTEVYKKTNNLSV